MLPFTSLKRFLKISPTGCSGSLLRISVITSAFQWKPGKFLLKIACKPDILCRVCEGGDRELPIDGVGTPAKRIGTWETVRQDGGALATVHQARAAKCCEIFV